MTLTLAPMEGVVDVHMRDILTRIGGFDLCVSEFIRVSNTLLPRATFFQICPELENGGKTASGVPVHLQLMGGDPGLIADNAAFAVTLGAPGIDLNFGCPAKTVNRHDAGATLLQWPDRLHDIVKAVRRAVPAAIPVSANLRLGFADTSLFLENAQAIEAGGAMKLTVHARTKLEGYKAPAHWEYLVPIREALHIPVVANGEIWSRKDFEACRAISGCEHFMVGRGVIANPSLGLEISSEDEVPYSWEEVVALLIRYQLLLAVMLNPLREAGRIKQWIKLLGRTYPEATELFIQIRRFQSPLEILEVLKNVKAAA